MNLKRAVLMIVSFMALSVSAQKEVSIRGVVCGITDKQVLPAATVLMQGRHKLSALTDINGKFSFRSTVGELTTIRVSYIGYKPFVTSFKASKDTTLNVFLRDDNQLKEVVVTAKEKDTPVTTSVIGRQAMQQLQPNSVADLMELLPGGYSKDPSMGTANTMTLRETGARDANGNLSSNNNYSISSLGTLFVVDGAPVITDANMQYSPLSSTQSSTSTTSAENNRNTTNKGVDLRSMSTDDIESIEVVRGIPSVEYGNMTSGMINIHKVRKVTPLTMRFKADGYSKLFSAGKGFALGQSGGWIMNVDGGYLDSKVDPTNNLENYKRLTGSLRLTKNKKAADYNYTFNSTLEYTGSFDNNKTDPDINYGRIDEYKSTYHNLNLAGSFLLRRPKSLFREFEANVALSGQLDRLHEKKLIAPQRYGVVPTTYDDGENVAQAVFSEYVADYVCDGKPLNAYIKAKGLLHFSPYRIDNNVKIGFDWEYSKNFGKGQEYDLSYPLSLTNWSSRPRKYSDIPALQTLSLFVEDGINFRLGEHSLESMVGARFNTLPGLNDKYDMSGKIYVDPRFNIRWRLPYYTLGGSPLKLSFSTGLGWTTKMPTLNYLYPDKYYMNFTELAYYDSDSPAQNSKFVVMTYVQDPTNYQIKPARNRKFELRFDADWNDNSLSIDYFNERMTSGYRYSSVYDTYTYKSYDAASMAAGVDYTTLAYTDKKVLDGYSKAENGTKILKQGVELQFTSQRIEALKTRINVTGAWFHTTYTNSTPMYMTVSKVVDNIRISDKYVGLYNWNDGRVNDQLNTNFTFDTQVPAWGLVFTSSFQFMWLVRTKMQVKSGIPMAYLSSEDGQLHTYTDADKEDVYLKQLIINYNEDSFTPFTVPLSMVVNLKATKSVGKYMKLSFFANKILDYLPDYQSNGYTIRRSESPYFGVEANFTF